MSGVLLKSWSSGSLQSAEVCGDDDDVTRTREASSKTSFLRSMLSPGSVVIRNEASQMLKVHFIADNVARVDSFKVGIGVSPSGAIEARASFKLHQEQKPPSFHYISAGSPQKPMSTKLYLGGSGYMSIQRCVDRKPVEEWDCFNIPVKPGCKITVTGEALKVA